MQYRAINKFIVTLITGLFATSAVLAQDEHSGASGQHAPFLLAENQSNIWALPQITKDARRPPPGRYRRPPEKQTDIEYPGYRFVTPEILESLKQQQMQNQQVPENYSNQPYHQPRSFQRYPTPPAQPSYGFPPMNGMGYSNPFYGMSPASPWNSPLGANPGVLNQGESFPGLPNAAIGGIPPIPMQPLIENKNGGGAENMPNYGAQQYQNNVFNPFTFGPNGNL